MSLFCAVTEGFMAGGTVQRGKVLTAESGEYTIASLDCDGIITPPIKPLKSTDTYAVDSMVYFFYFKDGTGRILCSCP